jgi:hypothetical protein
MMGKSSIGCMEHQSSEPSDHVCDAPQGHIRDHIDCTLGFLSEPSSVMLDESLRFAFLLILSTKLLKPKSFSKKIYNHNRILLFIRRSI